jgi:hypothetical protein
MYGAWGAPHGKYIAKRLYGNGNPNYEPSAGEIARVYRILKANGISLRDWRNGETMEAERFFNRLARLPLKSAGKDASHPKLRLAAVA